MRADFYHLTGTPLDRVLPRVAERVLAEGGRLVIVAADAGQAEALDRLLWTYRAESFLPHGRSGAGEAQQPVLIALDLTAANGARNVALVDGIWRDAALEFDRAFHFFDEDRIAEARAAWRALADRAGVERRYWKQDEEGRWQQAA